MGGVIYNRAIGGEKPAARTGGKGKKRNINEGRLGHTRERETPSCQNWVGGGGGRADKEVGKSSLTRPEWESL